MVMSYFVYDWCILFDGDGSVWLVGLILIGWGGGGFKWWGRGYNRFRF